MALLYNYFSPIIVQASLDSPTSMSVVLKEPDSSISIHVSEIPCKTSLTPMEVFEIIQLIEDRISAETPEIFERHRMNNMLR
ncbi:DUF1652 domain-containing protein [Pseudomonas sp. MM211]|uniref:DUF1652 domain-containing protein n=1 Tax=Pseudomonas sp. MM211 TaxID=2866808 RepID=UPI001CED74A1|nr:DUF1652 domain-containing protein [Pseudomonas sp. MM211]UCJ16225.1 DUF1652 domain-containing protein [Pseudomonas sp. MM211]